MKNLGSLLLLILFLGGVLAPGDHDNTMKDDYDRLWAKVDSLEEKGLPRSARDVVEVIISTAREDDNEPQLLKGLLHRSKYVAALEEDEINAIVTSLRSEVDGLSVPAAAVLHSILGDIYWRYYQGNRFVILDRTVTAGVEESDIKTWDARKLISQAVSEFRRSLEPRAELVATPVESMEVLLDEGRDRALRPTLYDFLAHRALEVFRNSETGLPEPREPFPFDDPRYMGTAEGFARLEIRSPDSLSTDYLAIRLFQDLVRLHLTDAEPEALIDVDLSRLAFVRGTSRVADRDSAYASRLRDMQDRYEGHPAGTSVTHALASVLVEEGRRYDPLESVTDRYRWRLKEAHALCGEAIARFPESYGARQCQALRASLEEKSASYEIEEAILPGNPFRIRLTYRNIQTVHVAIVPVEVSEMMETPFLTGTERDEFMDDLIGRGRAVTDRFSLEDDGDYQNHSTELPLTGLETGLYAVIVGSHPEFSQDGEARGISFFSATQLGIIERRDPGQSYEVRILDRDSGAPVSDATVTMWNVDYQDRRRFPRRVGTFITDRRGSASLWKMDGGSFFLTVEHRGDVLVSSEWRYAWSRGSERVAQDVSHYFTDRAIYRPGQRVHFKGILLRTDGDRHDIRAGASARVRLVDPNLREIASLDLQASEYGTVSGSFIAPTGAGTGQMQIRDDDGAVSFFVEEYKRPRFEVTFDSPEGEVELGDTVTVEGSAASFSGAPVDGGAVRYRVTRAPLFRPWQYGWSIFPPAAPAEIASGSTETDSEGRFSVSFAARPGDDIPASAHPIYRYSVVADVTDFAGETQSGSTDIRVGYRSLVLGIDTGDYWERESVDSVRIVTENLDGSFVPASGRMTVSRLESPGRLLRPRLWQRVDRPLLSREAFVERFPLDPYSDEDDPASWPVASVVQARAFDTAESRSVRPGDVESWPPGVYLIEVTATDSKGREVRAEKRVTVYSMSADRLPTRSLDVFIPVTMRGEPGDTARILVGSAAADVAALVEVERRGRITEHRRITLSRSQRLLEFPIEEEDRGNFAIHVSFARHGRAVTHTQVITVPYTNKQLTLKLETFRDELYPGQDEEWRLRITGSRGESVAAELLATMYDASLDQFVGHDWVFDLYGSRSASLGWMAVGEWGSESASLTGRWNRYVSVRQRSFDRLRWFGLDRYFGFGYARQILMARAPGAAPAEAEEGMVADAALSLEVGRANKVADEGPPEAPAPAQAGPVRTDFSETAFFFPDLRTNENGEVSLAFEIPEALTRWRMMGLAHTTDLRIGRIEETTVTRKDLMITANAPRFFRQGDEVAFAASVQSLADDSLAGTARLEIFELETMRPLASEFSLTDVARTFSLAPGRSEGLRWSIRVPEGVDAVVYRVTANAGSHSDGEQKPLPVLTNRMLVTESLPLPVRGPGTYDFTFSKLRDNDSPTLRHHAVTLEYSPNPVWYAVQALPYMMEFPHECSEQVFARLYANSIASHIVEQNPRIKTVFERWRDLEAGALQSNLEKNQELKSLVIEETPWLIAARNESERKRRIAVLFDFARMSAERSAAVRKLVRAQHATGAWPWFDGMPPSRYITQHVVAGFGHLDRLGIFDPSAEPELAQALERAIAYLDREIKTDYDELVRSGADLEERHLGWMQIHYLYARSYFTARPVPSESLQAFDYYVGQARTFWLDFPLYAEGMISLGLHRWGDRDVPRAIIRSLAENASFSDEMGMYWKFNRGFYWWQAPIETQALLIEAFDEITGDESAVADMQLWLLKQKQTQDWKTTKATTEAIYALLMRGTNLLDKESQVTIEIGEEVIDSRTLSDAEAGTGYFVRSWEGEDVSREMASVEVVKSGPGPAWGAVYWQYFEQLDRITPAETPLSIEKKLFREEIADSGPVLKPLSDIQDLSAGDRVTVRVIIRVDRDMEYVHLKDMRAAGFEPINVLSGHRYEGGLHYYESTRDAATHFFIGYLPKGTYVFEYPLRVNLAGDFSNGITSIQSMYAPEFASHSEGVRVRVTN